MYVCMNLTVLLGFCGLDELGDELCALCVCKYCCCALMARLSDDLDLDRKLCVYMCVYVCMYSTPQ